MKFEGYADLDLIHMYIQAVCSLYLNSFCGSSFPRLPCMAPILKISYESKSILNFAPKRISFRTLGWSWRRGGWPARAGSARWATTPAAASGRRTARSRPGKESYCQVISGFQ